MNSIVLAWNILRHLGPEFVCRRLHLKAREWCGVPARTFRSRPWDEIRLRDICDRSTPCDPDEYAAFKRRQAPAFLFPAGRPPPPGEAIRAGPLERRPPLVERIRLLEEGRCVLFFCMPSAEPIRWDVNPLDPSRRSDGKRPWFELPDFDPRQGDIRTLWEPARAAWALDLARARLHGVAVDAGGLLARWLDSFLEACPPFLGPQWKCGQESAVRFVALALAFWALADEPAITAARWVQLVRLAWATGHRIAGHISYAISQKNNHAISEACGLMLAARLFPELRRARAWYRLGRLVLQRELRRQIAPDGSYVQHSMNYQRVMLDGALLALRLAELEGRPFPRDIYDRVGRAGELLFQMMEPSNGHLPQYGDDDGALVLPLTECAFHDYRPVCQAVHYLVRRERLLPPGPWDEQLLWLFGTEALGTGALRRQPQSSALEIGGYYTLRGTRSWAMIRCHTYRDRPAHIDPLHLDLWWEGQNILRDCGTYQYYIPDAPALERYFRSIAAHNTLMVDDAEPVEWVSRFLCLPWPRARRVRWQADAGRPLLFEGIHETYNRWPWHCVHRRAVLGAADVWVIVDDLIGTGTHRACLRWHLADLPWQADPARHVVTLDTPSGPLSIHMAGETLPQGFRVVAGELSPVQGFAAPCYGQRVPIPVVEATWECGLPLRVLTVIGPGRPAEIRPREPGRGIAEGTGAKVQRWAISTDTMDLTLTLNEPSCGPILPPEPLSQADPSPREVP